MRCYVETSAAVKLLVEEPESAALASYLDGQVDDGVELISSVLLETELRRFAVRHDLPQSAVSELLGHFAIADVDRAIFFEAGILPGPQLRSLDALHIAVAVRTESDSIIAYDARQTEAARAVGLRVTAPV
ncbi:type II toxin-antitoxin system VapC family toxin [Amycolatopsis aidingensis]|uniref:type II toxin-antitoxin system VapC family toxin n=1 Tax=Amycolatopsis aidingensis TaxID=2842453 RepID=UPI001C0BA128|nr:type II toxin-antitoxin system VapC family toxin [Amycolatopsis aidingensis]